MNDKAQIHTVEGIAASALMILTVMLVTKSSLIVTPQSELTMDVQLKQTASDALAVLDMAPEPTLRKNLTQLVAGWDMTNATPETNSLPALNNQIHNLLNNVVYNVDFAYVNETGLTVRHAIINGAPIENSVVATRLVTLYDSTVVQEGGNWPMSNDVTGPNNVTVVEVRLIAWRV